jgi:hypothetical protein
MGKVNQGRKINRKKGEVIGSNYENDAARSIPMAFNDNILHYGHE